MHPQAISQTASKELRKHQLNEQVHVFSNIAEQETPNSVNHNASTYVMLYKNIVPTKLCSNSSIHILRRITFGSFSILTPNVHIIFQIFKQILS